MKTAAPPVFPGGPWHASARSWQVKLSPNWSHVPGQVEVLLAEAGRTQAGGFRGSCEGCKWAHNTVTRDQPARRSRCSFWSWPFAGRCGSYLSPVINASLSHRIMTFAHRAWLSAANSQRGKNTGDSRLRSYFHVQAAGSGLSQAAPFGGTLS